jgi:hypothetical protein
MWRLLPKSWFSQVDPYERAQSKVVDHLQATWQRTLAKAISRVSVCDTPEDVTAALAGLDSGQYAAVDRAIRFGDWDMDLGGAARGPVVLVPATPDQAAAESYLFTASCNANGFIREQALLSLRHFSGRIALAAALIRCDDWVPQVQQRAIELLRQLLAVHSDLLWELVDLLLVLRERKRIGEQAWTGLIENALRDPGLADARWCATRAGSPDARLLAYRMVSECEPEDLDRACLQAARDEPAVVARWALEQVVSLESSSQAREVLETGLKHPHPFVRADALRRIVNRDDVDACAIAVRFLFDSRRAPRNAARHILRTRFDVDAATHWRDAFDGGLEPRATFSAFALVEHAEATDLPRFVMLLRHDHSALRAAGLRGIAKVNTDTLATYLPTALVDPSPKVVRGAMLIGLRHPGLLSETAIRTAFASCPAAGGQTQLLKAARTLDKWSSIKLLLDWLSSSGPETSQQILDEIKRWLRRQNLAFTPLKHETKMAIEAALAIANEQLPVSVREQLMQTISVS